MARVPRQPAGPHGLLPALWLLLQLGLEEGVLVLVPPPILGAPPQREPFLSPTELSQGEEGVFGVMVRNGIQCSRSYHNTKENQ